jgi:hypothetical protein
MIVVIILVRLAISLWFFYLNATYLFLTPSYRHQLLLVIPTYPIPYYLIFKKPEFEPSIIDCNVLFVLILGLNSTDEYAIVDLSEI